MNRRLLVTVFAALVALPLINLMAAANAAAGKPKPDKPLHIAKGEEVNLKDYLFPGKTVVFDFYSDYCGPCVQVAPALEKLHKSRPDIVVVKVDINRPGVKGIDWRSPVARQHGMNSIPHFKVYGPDGKLIAEDKQGESKARQMVMAWVK